MSVLIEQYGVVAGLEWEAFESRRAAKDNARSHAWSVLRADGGDFVVGHTTQQIGGKSYSGALLLALHLNDAVLYEQLPDGEVWVAAVRSGMPLPGFDHICGEHEARAMLAEALSFVPSARLVGSIPEAELRYSDVLKALGNKKQAGLLRKKRGPLVVVGVMAAVGLASMTGWVAYHKISAANERKAAEAQAQLALMSEAASRAAALQALTGAARALLDDARRDLAVVTDSVGQTRAWMTALRTVPISDQGWQPEYVECDKVFCTVTWALTPMAGGTHPPTGEVLIREDRSIKTQLRLETPDQLPRTSTPRGVLVALANALTGIGGFEITVSKDLAPIAVTPQASDPKIVVAPIELGQRGEIRLSVPWAAAPDFAKKLQGRVAFNKMRANLFGGNLDIEGEYAEITEKR
jgi:hypothetical protein